MDIDTFQKEQKYLISFNSENLEEFLSQKKINIVSCVGIKGNYLHLQKIMLRKRSQLSQDKINIIANKIKILYNEENNHNIKNEFLLDWLFNGDMLILYSKDLFNNYVWSNIKSNYLISIKESNILKLFEKSHYKIEQCNIELNNDCQLFAIACRLQGKKLKLDKFIFIFKTKEHYICISPRKHSSLLDFCHDDYDIERKCSNTYCIEKLDFNLIDEVIDNNISLYNLDKKIQHTLGANCLSQRVETISNFFDSTVIPAGELADMMEFM